jgi:DNA-binding NarL/FixJ family response regulator
VIRVGIVDDHPVVLDGLRNALELEEGVTVAWSASSYREAELAIARCDAEVVLVDVRLGDGSGLDLITPAAGHTAFVVLSSWDRPQYARAAIKRGASGYLLKTAPMPEIATAIRTAARGGTTFQASHLASLANDNLTARELDVVRLVARGLSNDEVASQLNLSRKTVEAYLTRLYERWNVASRTELSLRAERDGWLDDLDAGPTRF